MPLNKIQQQMLEQQVQDRLNKVDEHTAQLAEIATEIHLEKFPIQVPEVDDTGRLQRAIDEAVNNYHTLILGDKTYNISSPIIIPAGLKAKGSKRTKIISTTGITAFKVEGAGLYLENVDFESATQDLTQNSFGLFIGKHDGTNYVYTNDHKIRNCTFKNYTTSIAFEGVYWCEIEDVDTFKDKFGITVNKDLYATMGADQLVATTMYFRRVYCHGTQGAGVQPVGSVGWTVYNTTNLIVDNCVSELYEKAGIINWVQSVSFNDLYMENCNIDGWRIENVTGSIFVKNLYTNNVARTFYLAYANMIMAGGRGLVNSGQYFIQRGQSGNYIELQPVVISGGGTYEQTNGGWELWNKSYIPKFVQSLPTASATYRGKVYVVISSGSSGDKAYICLKNEGASTYTWKPIENLVENSGSQLAQNATIIQHGLGVIPKVVHVTPPDNQTFAGVTNLTSTEFTLTARNLDGSLLATDKTFYWTAKA